ncbi:pinin-like [Branchiostoma floridae]|uniref:Pinin-like n=1 Tax=Branchiostoma floridae TaxID=7739 RepID=A0A9J7HK65_BRAFL|nr:pinin-like [Branchiostoma floridae]
MAVQGVEKYFFYIKEKVASDWKDLAFFLGFSGTDVGNIGGRNYDDKSSCMDLLQEWATANGTDATIEVLMEALSNAGLRSVADGLKAELATGQGAQPPDQGQPSRVQSQGIMRQPPTGKPQPVSRVQPQSVPVPWVQPQLVSWVQPQPVAWGQPQLVPWVQPQLMPWGQPQLAMGGPSNNTEELRPYFNIIAENMPADWPQLATNLGIPFAQIQAIQQQNRDNCWMCCQQILHMWCYNNGQEATVEVLMQAVRDTGHQDVAEMLEIKQLE